MKTACVLLLAGLVSCGQLFTPGYEYVYQYHGKILTGIPELDSQFAGLALQGQILIQSSSQDTYKMMMKNIKFGTFNEKLTSAEPKSWRNVEVEATTPLTTEFQTYMESPVEFKILNGEISSVMVSSDEPNWCINMKKALISALKIQLPSSEQLKQEKEKEGNPRFWYMQQQQQMSGDENLYYWTVMEEGIEGKCENTYQVSELPEYMINEYEQGMIKSELCQQGHKYWQVQKTRDITKCQESSVYVSSKAHKVCVTGNCESDNLKQSNTRYYGCGESVKIIQLHGMIQEGEMAQNVVAFNTEKVVTGTKQVLQLQEVTEVTTTIPEISNPKTCQDLSYEFLQDKEITSRSEQKVALRSKASNPRTYSWLHETFHNQFDTESLKTQIVEKLQQVASELVEVEHYAEKEIPNQLKELKTIVSVMNTQDIHDLFNAVNSLTVSQEIKDICRSFFFDIVRNAGSPSTVMFLKDAVEQELLTESEMYYTVVTLAHYIKLPTEELIHEIFLMIKSDAVQQRWWLKGSADLVFANIVRNACIYTSKSYYPENVFGKMCSTSNQKITEEYIPYLVSQLKNAQYYSEKRVAIYALGQLGHESVLPLLISYLEGKVEESDYEHLRKDVIYALNDVAEHYRYQLLPVFLAIAHNPAESRVVRMAAIATIFKMKPETVHLQKLAISTWFEQDQEIVKFIYSTLKSNSNLAHESHPMGSYLYKLSEKCQTVLPLAKPMHSVLSTNMVYSGYLENLEIGAYMLNSMMNGQSSTEIYHKTEYFLKQVQTTPMEMSVFGAGLKPAFKKLMKYFTEESSVLHPQLKQLIEKLEITPRSETPFQAGAWLRLSDDINFAFQFDKEHMNLFKNKVLKAVKDSGISILSKVCGKTPINFQNVFEELPYEALVPSDLGLPIIVESQMTYLYNIQGQLNVECSFNKPSVSLEVANKMSYTYNGYAGTVCPFTQETLLAGINIHRATNLPIKTMVQFQPTEGQLKVSMQQNEHVTSNTQYIDVHHYHVKPYTVQKPFVFKDLTPSVSHQNTKYIHSSATKKTFTAPFGKQLGLDMTYNVETECDVFDAKTMLDSYANFNYNPVAASWFSIFAETALTAEGLPTARYHKYTFVHNPSTSSTKGAEFSVNLSVATKEENKESKKISMQQSLKMSSQRLEQSSRTDQRLEDCLRKLDSKTSYAVHAHVEASLIGGQTKTYTYSLTAGAGQNSLKHKWSLHFENEENSSMKSLCVDGYMSYPTSPSSEAKFMYSNKFGFGQTCDQYYVNVEGNTQVSSKQREYSSNSYESKNCWRFSNEEESYRHKIKLISEEDLITDEIKLKKSQLEKKHSEIALKKIKYCSKKVDQSRTLDQTVFTVTYSQDLPSFVYHYATTMNTALKGVLFSYISKVSQSTQTDKIYVKLTFHQTSNTVTMQLESPEDTVVFSNIRLGQLGYTLPLIAGQNPIEKSYKTLTGSSLLAKCVVGQGYIQSFDKKTYSYQVDECDHVVASDCSKDSSHSILTKEVNGLKHLTIYQGLAKIQLRPAHAYTSYVDEYILSIDGETVPLKKNQIIKIKSSAAPKEEISAYWSNDNTVQVSTSSCRVTHYGQTIVVEEKSFIMDGSHCGLCGDYNGDKRADIKSPKECVFSSNKLAAMSYRSKSKECKPLPSWALEKISSENMKCQKYSIKKTPVSEVYKTGSSNSYTLKKHSYIYKEDKICISQQPVVQCVRGSVAKDIKKKSINFVCLPQGRVASLYQHRIENGESPQELKHQPVAFKAEMDQPVSCGPSQIY